MRHDRADGGPAEGAGHADRSPLRAADVLERDDADPVGEAVSPRGAARAGDHDRRVPAQHGEVADRTPWGRDDVLPRGEARRLCAAQSRKAHPHAASRRFTAVHRVQHVRHRVPGQGDRDRGRFRSRRSRAPQVPGAFRDRLLALRVLRHVRGGVPRVKK